MSDIKIEVNCATGEVTEVPLTAEEIQQRELDAIAAATAQAEREATEAAAADAKASAVLFLMLFVGRLVYTNQTGAVI